MTKQGDGHKSKKHPTRLPKKKAQSTVKQDSSKKKRSPADIKEQAIEEAAKFDPYSFLTCFKNPYFTFSKDGTVSGIYDAKVPELLEVDDPKGMSVLELLRVNPKERANYESWLDLMFNETLSFDEAAELGPLIVEHSDESKFIKLDYRPVRDPSGLIIAVLVLVRDESGQHKKNIEAGEREMRSKFLLKAFTFKTQFVDFISELKMVIFKLREFGNNPSPENHLEAKRLLHTLTGATSYFHLTGLEDCCRSTELSLRKTPKHKTTELAKIFLSACLKFNELYQNLFREYSPVLGKPAFNNQISREVPLRKLEAFHEKLLARTNDTELQEVFLNEFVKIPLNQLFSHYEGVIQDTATLLAKKVKPMRIVGDHILVYESPYKNLFGSFIHIFNNVMDHGIEDPYTRKKMGKPEEGSILIEIRNDREEFIEIVISDDGRGIDIELIKRKLEVNNINFSFLTDEEILQTVFLPDFSTRDDIGKFSGRGIGLNAVADELEKIGGSITVQSRFGLGVTFHIQIPVLSFDGEPI